MPLTAGRSRWAVLAITLISFVGLFVVTSGAQAVLGSNGQPVSNGATQPGQQGGSGNAAGPLQVRIQLMPQALKQVLSSGIALRVTSNEGANGFAYVSVPRAIARRLHLRAGQRLEVVIGEGTVSEVKHGTVMLHLHFAKSMIAKLRRLHRVTFEVGLQLVGPAGDHLTIDAAGRD